MSFDKSKLMDVVQNVYAYKRGEAYAADGRVHISINAVESGIRTVMADVSDNNGKENRVTVRIDDATSEIQNYSCTCPVYLEKDGGCKHVAAAVLAACGNEAPRSAESAQVKKAEVKSDMSVSLLIKAYANEIDEEEADACGAEIKPVIQQTFEDVTLGFRIGSDKFYVIKDLKKFKQNMLDNETVEYGKSFTFTHSFARLNRQSRALASFILSHVSDEPDKMYYLASPQKQLNADGYLLDDFFAIYTEDTILFDNKGVPHEYNVRRENPKISIRLINSTADSYKLKLDDDIAILGTGMLCYMVSEDNIYVCDKAFTSSAAALVELLCRRKSGVNISHNDIKTFYGTVIQPALEYISLEAAVDIEQLAPVPLESKLYLDMPQDNVVTAELKFCYGDEVHAAFQPALISRSPDLKGEVRAQRLLSRFFSDIDEVEGIARINGNEAELFTLIDRGIDTLSEHMTIYATDRFKTLKVRPQVKMSIGVRIESDLLHLDIDVEDFDINELVEIIASCREGNEYHKLADGSFVKLTDTSVSELSEIADTLNLSDKDLLEKSVIMPRYRMLYLDSVLKQNKQIRFERDKAFRKTVRELKSVTDSDLVIPRSLEHTLRGYQVTGYRWMKTISAYGFGGILADDMGLGKTLETIAFLLSEKEDNGSCKALVVCPSSLVLNWENEFKRWAPSLTTAVVMGNAAEREEIIAAGNPDVFITSYDLLKRDILHYDGISFRFEIIDEAQYIKNHTTQNSKAVKVVKSDIRFALTGTPVENNLAELWSVFDYLMPGYLYNYNKFRDKFEIPVIRENDEKALESLRRLALPFILRRMKKDVLKELPEKTETVLYAAFDEEQRRLYDATAMQMRSDIRKRMAENGEENNRFEILAMLTKLRQICCAPTLAVKKKQEIIPSAKLEMCMELTQNCVESGHRVLIFSQFTSMLDIIAENLEEMGIAYYTITGKTKSKERIHLVNSFNRNDTPVFLISLRAGGTGLNLTGADVVIHFDPWWNMSAQNQATDRAYRIGQLNRVQVYKLIAKDTIEEKIVELQGEKNRLAESVIKDGDGGIMRMSPAELLEML